jgi:hypothetical protein
MRAAAKNQNTPIADNAEKLYSGTLTNTQHFDVGYSKKFPQRAFFELEKGVEKRCKLLNLNGGRGRNRTYNLSVKRTFNNVISTTYAERLAA